MADQNYLYITPQHILPGYGPDDQGNQRVSLVLEYDSKDAPWLAPDICLAISMTPPEARKLAQSLERMADAAEAATLRH